MFLNSGDLRKNESYEKAKDFWNIFNTSTQTGDQIVRSPIIVGLRKTDKLISYPFYEYKTLLHNCLFRSKKLLIVGYSFDDLYINALLEKFNYIHRNERRIAIVDYLPPNFNWDRVKFSGMNSWPVEAMMSSLFRMFKEQNPFKNILSKPENVTSGDGKSSIYLNGFQDSIDKNWIFDSLK